MRTPLTGLLLAPMVWAACTSAGDGAGSDGLDTGEDVAVDAFDESGADDASGDGDPEPADGDDDGSSDGGPDPDPDDTAPDDEPDGSDDADAESDVDAEPDATDETTDPVDEPDADEPDADEPDADEPDADEPDADEPDGAPPITLEIGTGDIEFQPLTPGQTLMIHQGFQGGFHVFGAFRIQGIDPARVEHSWELHRGEELVAATYWQDDLLPLGEWFGMYGVTVVLSGTVAPESLEGAELILSVEIPAVGVRDSETIITTCCEFL